MMELGGYCCFTDWKDPECTLRLCQHVMKHGPERWDLLHFNGTCCSMPAKLCALRWHSIQIRFSSSMRTPRNYSDWELCVLFVAASQQQQHSKKAMHADLAKWLPGRSADALRQAYAHNIAGNEARLLAKLTANNWPSDVPGLLAAWPGPTPQAQALLDAEGSEWHKQAAAQIIQELAAWAPLARKQSAGPFREPAGAAAEVELGVHAATQRLPAALAKTAHARSQSQLCGVLESSSMPDVAASTVALSRACAAQAHHMLCMHQQPAPASTFLQQRGAQLPVLGLDAFAGMPAAAAVSSDCDYVQQQQQQQQDYVSGTVWDATVSDISMGLPSLQLSDLPAQIAADLASPYVSTHASTSSRPGHNAGTNSAAAAAAAAAAGVLPALNPGCEAGLRGDQGQLMQLFGLQEAGGTPHQDEDAACGLQHDTCADGPAGRHSYSPHAVPHAGAASCALGVNAGVQQQHQEQQYHQNHRQQQLHGAGYPSAAWSAAPEGIAPAGAFGFAQHGLLPPPAAAGDQVSAHQFHTLLAHVQRVEQQQQSMLAMMAAMQAEFRSCLQVQGQGVQKCMNCLAPSGAMPPCRGD